MNGVECPKGGFCRWVWAAGINGSRYRYCEKCAFIDKFEVAPDKRPRFDVRREHGQRR